jgi:hypothetical protein
MPVILVGVSSLIGGIESAVTISAAIAIAEILLLSYFWVQLPSKIGNLAQGGFWLSAIAIGIVLGLNLTN